MAVSSYERARWTSAAHVKPVWSCLRLVCIWTTWPPPADRAETSCVLGLKVPLHRCRTVSWDIPTGRQKTAVAPKGKQDLDWQGLSAGMPWTQYTRLADIGL